jgi:hypothetical protein
MRRFVLAALAATISVAVSAQDQGTAILYSKAHFAGHSATVSAPTTQLPPFEVKSLRIRPGTVWELCSGNTFSGCERYSESKAAMVRMVRSVRPVLAPIAQSVTLPSDAPVSGSGPSLRGLSSEFFVVPAQAGSRVEVTQATGAESIAATKFCRTRGWRTSPYQRAQSVSGRTFLADVLCTN